MNKQKIIWLDRFFEDYQQFTLRDHQKSETEIIEILTESGTQVEMVTIPVEAEVTTDGQGRLYQFEMIEEDQVKTLKYIGWIDG